MAHVNIALSTSKRASTVQVRVGGRQTVNAAPSYSTGQPGLRAVPSRYAMPPNTGILDDDILGIVAALAED